MAIRLTFAVGASPLDRLGRQVGSREHPGAGDLHENSVIDCAAFPGIGPAVDRRLYGVDRGVDEQPARDERQNHPQDDSRD